MKIGFIGLGKMGKNMVLRLLEQDIEVVAWNRSSEPLKEATDAGAISSENPLNLVSKLDSPRTIWLMLPQGPLVDEMIGQIEDGLTEGDLIIDGGNSFYKDSQRRAQELDKRGIHFMDVGVSGGPEGARNGACLMIGGNKEDFDRVKELVERLSAPEAFGYLGKVGAGHFAKMVHNGIEYGMMESIAEGAQVLKDAEFGYDQAKVWRVYNNRTVIESRLAGWMQKAFEEDSELSEVSSKINATGEGEWTINAAKEMGLELPAIEAAFKVRQDSTTDSNNFRDKAVSALRGQFGGHDVKKSD